MAIDPNRLLFVISARKRMRWTEFSDALDILSADSLRGEWMASRTAIRSIILQCLQALGHCDVYYDQGLGTIVPTPPSLCRLPKTGLPLAVLTGARAMNTQEELVKGAESKNAFIRIKKERLQGFYGLLPDAILIEADSQEALVQFASNLGLCCPDIPPAWTLGNWCGTLQEYEATLDYNISENLNWNRYDYNVDTAEFNRASLEAYPRLSRYLNPTTSLPVHVFFRGNSGAEVDLNWGRYLLLRVKGLSATGYDERSFRLCAPAKAPLPSVIARAFCLSSGKPPVYKSGVLVPGCKYKDWLIFESVPPQIAILALSKVGQSPARIEIP